MRGRGNLAQEGQQIAGRREPMWVPMGNRGKETAGLLGLACGCLLLAMGVVLPTSGARGPASGPGRSARPATGSQAVLRRPLELAPSDPQPISPRERR